MTERSTNPPSLLVKAIRIAIALVVIAVGLLVVQQAWKAFEHKSPVLGPDDAGPAAGEALPAGAAVADPGSMVIARSNSRNDMAALSVSKSEPLGPVQEDHNFDYTLTVTNAGPVTAVNVVVRESLSPEVTFVGAAGPGWNCEDIAGTPTCRRDSLAVGTAPLITVTVTAMTDDAALAYAVNVSADNTLPAAARKSPHAAPPVVHRVIKNMLLKSD